MNVFEYKSEKDLCGLFSFAREHLKDGCVLALGFFDGVHVAHRALLNSAYEKAKNARLPLAVFTFFSEDSSFKGEAKRIYSTEDRLGILASLGTDAAIVCDFGAIKNLSREAFVSDILISTLNAKCTVCGFNFRFGCGALGNADFLLQQMSGRGLDCIVLDELSFEGKPLSSTLIRELLMKRDLDAATKALGSPYFISGAVQHGRGYGRTYGIPTVNTDGKNILLPAGVYRTATVIDGKIYEALTNVGTCPTFGERETHAETFILDFDGDLYGKSLRIYFLGFLREEKVFEDENSLKMQINVDKNRTKELNGDIKWQELGLS